MTMPLYYSRSVNSDLYAQALGSTYQGYRIYQIDYALAQDADVWEKIRRDPVVAHAIDQRLHRVSGSQWHLAPGGDRPQDKTSAALVEDAIREYLSNFTEGRYELAQAVILGRTWAFMSGCRKLTQLGNTPDQEWWVCERLEDIDRRRFRFMPIWEPAPEGKKKLRMATELYSVERQTWEVVEHPEWFVRHVYNDEEARLSHGRGLLEAIYFYHWIKTRVLQEGINWVERWAQGMVTAKIDGLREGTKELQNQDVLNKWVDVFKSMRSRNFLAYGSDDEVQIHDPPGTGAEMTLKFLEYLDVGITRLVVGGVRNVGGGGERSTGARAQAEVEADESEALIQYDRTLLDEALTRDLVGAFWRNNRPQLAMVGLADARKPHFESIQERREDPEAAARVIVALRGANIPLRKDEVYRKVGFTPPTDEDDVLEAPPSPTFPGGEGFGGDEQDEIGNSPGQGHKPPGQPGAGTFQPKAKAPPGAGPPKEE